MDVVAGAIICESLKPGTVLAVEGMVVTRWSRSAVETRAEYQPATWTLIEFEAPEEASERLAQELADALLEPGWYANWNSRSHAVVVFPNKIFRYAHGDLDARARAEEHGRRCGVPDAQLDWDDEGGAAAGAPRRVTRVSAIDVDLLDPAFYADLDGMHEVFTRWRRDDPVHRDERNRLWAVTRHADVVDVERRAKAFVSGLGYRSFHSPDEDNMIAQDDPGHAEQRAIVARRLTPKAVQQHEAYLRDTVGELLDAVAGDGRMEVVDALAAQLPGRVTASLLGFPEDRWRDIKSWSERMMRYDRMQDDPEALMGTMTSIQEFSQVLFPTYEARKREPKDDLVSAWAQADGCPYDDQGKLINETGLFISGGAETTRTVIGRGLRVFCDHQDQWEALAADPSLVPSAVEEVIRWVTPLNNFFRTAATDSTIGDQEVQAGDRVILLYPSANRDEDVFADPFTFDVRRSPNPHVAFGFGPHVCVGAPLARLELRILFEELTRRFTNLRVLREPELEENIFASAVISFELGFDVR